MQTVRSTKFTVLAGAALIALPGVATPQGADLCGNAQPIAGIGTFSVSTVSAGTDGPSACVNLGRDVWFAWTAPATGAFQISTCPAASFDTVLAAYSGTCTNLTQLNCNDDFCGARSQIGVAATSGTTYLIRVGGYNGVAGTATMEISQGGTAGGCMNSAVGPDAIMGEIPNMANYGLMSGMAAYSFGTTSCNTGDAELNWIANSPQHPVIGQNVYRLENGRFEQLGMGWLKHGVSALQSAVCCSCIAAGSGARLGVGCSTSNSAGLHGYQPGLGPRSQVNGFTGAFSYPYATQGQAGDRIYKRIQVPNDDVSPTLHPSARYFGEALCVTPDDAAAGNGFNNASWVDLTRPGSTTVGAFTLRIGGATNREDPAIHAWEENEPGVTLAKVLVPNEGEFIAGSNVIDNGDGTWRYEYAVFNNNSHFSAQSFTVPIGAGVLANDVGMSFPLYHSGEPYSNVGWAPSVAQGTSVTWSTEPFMMNQNANALRWGTMYSFWFTANAGPEAKTASIGLFRPGNPGPQSLVLEGPMDTMSGVLIQSYCAATVNSTGTTSKILASNVDLVARTLDLEAYDLPLNAAGYFITSTTEGFVPGAGGSQGNLCLGGDIGRGVGGGVFSSGATGSFAITFSLDNVPTPTGSTSVMAGETRSFQAWHRDSLIGTPTSNFTHGVRLVFP